MILIKLALKDKLHIKPHNLCFYIILKRNGKTSKIITKTDYKRYGRKGTTENLKKF